MRLDTAEVSSQSDVRTFRVQDGNSETSLMTPARRAALDALEREFHDLLNRTRRQVA